MQILGPLNERKYKKEKKKKQLTRRQLLVRVILIELDEVFEGVDSAVIHVVGKVGFQQCLEFAI